MQLVSKEEKDFLAANKSLVDSSAKLGTIVTANKSATQAASTATDVAGIVADFNALLAKLKTAGIVA